QSQDTRFKYDVHVLPGGGAIDENDLHLLSFATVADGDVTIIETKRDAAGNVVATLLVDKTTPDAVAPISPAQTFLTVSKDIAISGGAAGGTGKAAISDFSQTYHETPEPGTVAMLIGMGVSGSLFGFRLRRRR